MSAPEGRPPLGVILSFALAMLCAAGFAACYTLGLGTETYGATLGGALAFLSLGLAIWASRISKHEPEYVEERAVGPTPKPQFEAFTNALVEQPIPRSNVLWGMFAAALATLGGALVFPLRSLWPTFGGDPDQILSVTAMARGLRLVTEEGEPVRPDDLSTESVVTVFPEGFDPRSHMDSATLLIRVDPSELDLPPDHAQWVVDGVVAYSKICTHAGCPVGLYSDTYRQLLCPCHHSIFDVLTGANPVEGPASRPLPQLPLGTDPEGYLIALGDFDAPPGPGWWGYPT